MTIDKLKEEYEQKINKLREEFDDKIAKLQEEESNKRWKPKIGEIYWFIDNGGDIFYAYWDDAIIDNSRYELGNCFKSQEEASFTIEQFKVLAQLRREYVDDDKEWNNNDNWHWCIEYDTIEECIRIHSYHYIMSTPFNLYFSSEEQARKAINAIGEDKLKKYYFCEEK